MLKSIYTPLSAAVVQERVLEMIANNLANMNTNGFKRDKISFTLLEPEPYKAYKDPLPPANYKISFEDIMPLRGNETSYVGVGEVFRDTSQGPAIQTKNDLDIMIEGEGHFAVQTDEGVRYTRAGSFSLNGDGILITKQGHPVMGEKGDILVRGGSFRVNSTGEVWQDGNLVDRLAIYRFNDQNYLERVGKNYFYYGGPEDGRHLIELPQVQQGFLEGSNVNAIQDMTNMILAHRYFEAYQKAVSNYDSMMEKSSNVIGDVRA